MLHLFDEISQEPGLAIDMDFQPGDVQWLLNYAALHSRTSFTDFPEPERRRHLLRLWLKRDVGRPSYPSSASTSCHGRPTRRSSQAGGSPSVPRP